MNACRENALISVIVVTYNSGRYVCETLDSIEEQSYRNIEIIVSDDSSKDDTVEQCRKWMDINRDRFKKEVILTSSCNTGIAANCNRGIRAAQGEWIKLIAGDDALERNILQDYMSHMSKYGGIRVIHSNARKYLEKFEDRYFIETTDLSNLKINRAATTPEDQYQILLRSGPIFACTAMIQRSVLDEVGLFDEESPFWEDTPMWLKITKKGIKIHFLNIVGGRYRVHQQSIQWKDTNRKLFSIYKLCKDNYYYDHFVNELPLSEKLLTKYLIRCNKAICAITRNRKSLFAKMLVVITGFVPQKVLSRMNQKYL